MDPAVSVMASFGLFESHFWSLTDGRRKCRLQSKNEQVWACAIFPLLKIKQRSKKELPHSRDGTPCGESTILYQCFHMGLLCAQKNTYLRL